MTTPMVNRRPKNGLIWWLASVPYAFIFGLFVAAFPGYTWTILHNFVPSVVIYWIAYYSACIWLIMFAWPSLYGQHRTFRSFLRLAIAVVAVGVPLVFSGGWPGF